MGFNINNKETYRYVSEGNFITSQFAKTSNNQLKAHGDTIGLTTNAYIPYRYEPFVDMVKSCYVEKEDEKGKYIKGYRSPLHVEADDDTMSRDHVAYTLIMLKLAGEDEFIKKLAKNLRWKISGKYSFTIDFWLWMKGISGNRFYMFLYYLIDIPVMLLSVLWNSLVLIISGVGPEVKQKDFVLEPDSEKLPWIKACRSLLYPAYAMYIKAAQLYVSPKSPGRWLLRKICLLGTNKENYVIRLFLGGEVKNEDVYSYKAMYGYRWWDYLNKLSGGYGFVIENPTHYEENAIDVDILRYLYEKHK